MKKYIQEKINITKLFILTHLYKLNDNRGMGVVEVILIILVIVGLIVIFRTNIISIITSVFSKITSQVNSL